MNLLALSLAPVLIILLYIYLRDKYEKEPILLLLKGLFFGAIIIIPVGFVEQGIESFNTGETIISKSAYSAFLVAGFTEELFKYITVFLLFWHNRNFNEKYDGIVYAVSVSLGFAAIENIMYVLGNQSFQIGLMRAFTAVPGHTIFGITMGFYLGMARFSKSHTTIYLCYAFIIPWILHGIYDFLLMTGYPVMLLIFVPFLIFLYRYGLRKMRQLNEDSIFNPKNNS